MSEADGCVYHLAPASQLRLHLTPRGYAPPSLAREGFIHCTATAALTLQVAADYFAGIEEPLVLLAIDPRKLRAPLYYEAAAPIEGGGTGHLASGALFPHLYGVLDLEAVAGAAELERRDGAFVWPVRFGPLGTFLG